MARNASRTVIALGVGLLLADASIVVLALPDLLNTLHTTVEGVAAVLFVYIGVLALATATGVGERHGARRLAAVGFGIAAAASVLAAASDSLAMLLVARAAQAAGGGLAIRGGFDALDGGAAGRRHWVSASLAGTAVGPALGGALTQAFDWRAIFIVQAPVLLLSMLAALAAPPATPAVEAAREDRVPAPRGAGLGTLALALVSAALSVLLFLLVLILVAGWDDSPLAAAAALTVLPVAALTGARLAPWIGGSVIRRGVVGSLLIGAGAAALSRLPGTGLGWTIAPQLVAGLGAGLALPALSGELLPERSGAQAARLICARSLATALLLAGLAPLIGHRLDSAARTAELRGVELVLRTPLAPQTKFRLAPQLLVAVRSTDALESLRTGLAAGRRTVPADQLPAFDAFGQDAQAVLVDAVRDCFAPGMLASGACALLAALLLLAARSRPATEPRRRQRVQAVALLLIAALVLPLLYVTKVGGEPPPPDISVAATCRGAPLPGSGGISGFLQDRAIQLLDTLACHLHASRAELVLAAADPAESRRFAATHGGVNPNKILGTIEGAVSEPGKLLSGAEHLLSTL